MTNTDLKPNPAVILTITVHAQEPLPDEDPHAYVDYLVESVTDGLRESIIKMLEKIAEDK